MSNETTEKWRRPYESFSRILKEQPDYDCWPAPIRGWEVGALIARIDELDAAASRLAELQEEVVKLRGVEAQAVEWFNKAEEGYRIVQALQKELDVARAETNEQRARADGWRDKFNADTDRIAGLEAANATLTERVARQDEIVREALAEIDANPDWHVHGYAYLTLQALAATSPAAEKES